MPELPDLVVYAEHLAHRVVGVPLTGLEVISPFVLRTAQPPTSALIGKRVIDVRRMGKRIVLAFEGDLFAVIHLMRAGRLRWLKPPAKLPGRITLAVFRFDGQSLVFTEAGTRRRASLHVVEGTPALKALDPDGLEVLDATLDAFAARLRSENHGAKRALTDGHLFSGIGGAYAD